MQEYAILESYSCGVAEERDELEQAWQALAERERLVSKTLARRSAEIDARARRYEEIGADLDARRRLIEESEDELRTRAQRVALAEEELRDRQTELAQATAEAERLRERARELDVWSGGLRGRGGAAAEGG